MTAECGADYLREGFRSIENQWARHLRIEFALDEVVEQILGRSGNVGGAFD